MKNSGINMQTVIILAFFALVMLWAISKCNQKRDAMRYTAGNGKDTVYVGAPPVPLPDTPKVTVDTQKLLQAAQAQLLKPAPPVANAPGVSTDSAGNAVPPAPIPATTTTTTIVKTDTVVVAKPLLYVVVDGLNVRTSPSLKAKSLGKLKLHDQVTFMNEVTDSTQTLSLGKGATTEPWVKIKTKRGTVGWVFGAGVSYYKKKKQ